LEKERFKKLFPHLAEEMESGASRVSLTDVEEAPSQGKMGATRKWIGHNPDVIDFIRRCETIEQAEEIIGYVEQRGEISSDRATELRSQLREKGLRSFGCKKEAGFYHRDR
jgi:hypothetical protein